MHATEADGWAPACGHGGVGLPERTWQSSSFRGGHGSPKAGTRIHPFLRSAPSCFTQRAEGRGLSHPLQVHRGSPARSSGQRAPGATQRVVWGLDLRSPEAGKLGRSFTTTPCICCVNIFSDRCLLKLWASLLGNKTGALAQQDLHGAERGFRSQTHCPSPCPSNQSKGYKCQHPKTGMLIATRLLIAPVWVAPRAQHSGMVKKWNLLAGRSPRQPW